MDRRDLNTFAPIVVCAMSLVLRAFAVHAQNLPLGGDADSRIRVATYNPDQVYRLPGYVGYQIDLEFEPGEAFVGLGAGDVEGLSFVAQDNHLFLKPKAAGVETNITVLTNRRQYHFDYAVTADRPDPIERAVIYSLRFRYPTSAGAAATEAALRVDRELAAATAHRARNVDYWYCGHPSLKPVAASDDGVHTRLRFGARSELPAVFVRNEDGSESLLNFSMDAGDLVIHRVSRQLILRRGKLQGCIVNKQFDGGSERLDSGTVAPSVERATKGAQP